MCELFGYSGKTEIVINEYLKMFFKHSTKHPNGWGIACMDRNETIIEKEPIQATKSHYLKARLSCPIASKNIFAHIRYATVGNEEYNNCHPYIKTDNKGRKWTLIHNGTIFDFKPLSRYIDTQKGTTDSERILLYIVDKINSVEVNGKQLSGRERLEIIDCIIRNMSKGNKLNLLIYDGEYTYVHSNYRESLSFLKGSDSIIFSTSPLIRGNWQSVPFNTLLAYKEGELIFTGKRHNHEYIENEEDMKLVYRYFSGL